MYSPIGTFYISIKKFCKFDIVPIKITERFLSFLTSLLLFFNTFFPSPACLPSSPPHFFFNDIDNLIPKLIWKDTVSVVAKALLTRKAQWEESVFLYQGLFHSSVNQCSVTERGMEINTNETFRRAQK